MSNEKSHKIDAIKYFVPLPEGDYDFQEHLTDYLLTDILNANKQLEKYEARVKELEEKLKRKTQECEELKNNLHIANTNHEAAEKECDRYLKALEEIKKVCIEDTREFADGTQVRYDSLDDILNIINKAKGDN